MKNACIVYDSASNIKNGQFKDVYVLPQQIIEVQNEKETNFKDGVDISIEAMEKNLLDGYTYKTSATNPADTYTLFEKLSKEYKNIYVFLIPNTLSAGQNNGVTMVAEDFPAVIIIPHYMVALMSQWECAELVALNEKNKLDKKSAIKIANDYKDTVGTALIVPDVSYLVKGGRISKTKGKLAKLFRITALVSFDRDGVVFRDKSSNIDKLFEMILDYYKTNVKGFSFAKVEKVCILQSTITGKKFDGEKYKSYFTKNVFSKLPKGLDIEVQPIPGAILAHVGPNYYAVALKIKK